MTDDLSTSLFAMASSGKPDDLWDALTRLFTREHSAKVLIEYFDTFAAADAYVDIKQLVTAAKSGENLEVYLYLGVLRFEKNAFPLFYVSLNVEMEAETTRYRISLKPQILVYKRAVDYILQETNSRTDATSPINQRILYATGETTLANLLRVPTIQVLSALRLPPEFRMSPDNQTAAELPQYSLESSLHLAVYDKSDESLLNDYEELLTAARGEGGQVLDLFEGIVRAVVMDDPRSVDRSIADSWDQMPISDRLVQASPIPINEEQSKIISALKQPDCRFVLVEGPPGTGKSHTISAIAFDAILAKKSVLLLSDKKEALDVVEDKLEQTLASVRPSGLDFPNPILRLGKEGNNFRSLLQGAAVQQINDFNRAARSRESAVKSELDANIANLKGELERTAAALSRIQINRIADLHRQEEELESFSVGVTGEIRKSTHSAAGNALADCVTHIPADAEEQISLMLWQMENADLDQLQRKAETYEFAFQISGEMDCSLLRRFHHLSIEDASRLAARAAQVAGLKRPLIGYLFRSAVLAQLAHEIAIEFAIQPPLQLPIETGILTQAAAYLSGLSSRCRSTGQISADTVLSIIVGGDSGKAAAKMALPLREFLALFEGGPPPGLKFEVSRFRSAKDYASFLLKAIQYAAANKSLTVEFSSLPDMDFVGNRTKIEQLYSTRMANEIDGRFLTFVQEHRAEAKALGAVIKGRQKFPEDRFDLLRSAFPVIIASIREFAEYMPLMPDLFDIVVIDEASQVSIAQAFPAILRAKKVVVLGDSKQFSNVKSSQASNELNQQCRSDIEKLFRQTVSNDASRLQRLAMFDVKKSVLEFVESCANYKTMLRKHFRGYLELISFSSKYFYGGTLQAVKIRGCPIGNVIEFANVQAQPESDNVNMSEGQYILDQLRILVGQEKPLSVGVITPFRNQQIALQKMFSADQAAAEFESKLRLKVMTFDSCQGEERGIIFYSLVASEHSDRLSWIFPPAIDQSESHVEDKLRMQRLNVGFSRAQEKIWFVLSKPIEQYRGSIARVLQHYKSLLDGRKIASPSETDVNSPMERKLLEWLKSTRLFQLHGEVIELVAQFPIGEYLQQLDPTYKHPAWKTDFLLRVPTNAGRAVQIIIEYDGFEFHFTDHDKVHARNFDQYMTESDVERQKTLESYGYKFLRFNRFNVGEDPVSTISQRLDKLINLADVPVRAVALDAISLTVDALQNGTAKECPRCRTVKNHDAFFDRSLSGGKGGYGRFCMSCKLAR